MDKEFQQWISGTVPLAPSGFETKILTDRMEGERIFADRIEIWPQNKARMTLGVDDPGRKVPFLCISLKFCWAQLAVRRGHRVCLCRSGYEDDTQAYQALYPPMILVH
jgi:hypothetical protein